MSWNDDPDFVAAIKIVLQDEGGFQNQRGDQGNWTGGAVGVGSRKGTAYGISAAQYPDLDIANLTAADASAILYRDYWEKYGYSSLRPVVNAKVFNLSMWFGPMSAGQCLQRAVRACGVALKDDGDIGPKTQAAVNTYSNVEALMTALRSEAAAHVRCINQHKIDLKQEDPDFNGWLARAYR